MHDCNTSDREIAVDFAIAFWRIFIGPATLSCSTDRTYELPGSHVWAVLSSEKSRSPATGNSRTRLPMKLSQFQKRDYIEFYLFC